MKDHIIESETGFVIRTLRQEHNMTQKQLAFKLNVSDKTISKWERGAGLPDISFLPALAKELDVDEHTLLSGVFSINDFVSGNLKNTKFFVCPTCHNITLCTGNAKAFCCGKGLQLLEQKKASLDEALKIELIEKDWYITSNHPMIKDHYISFVAFITGDRINMMKQYPEWDLSIRLPKRGHGLLLWYCTQHGLFYQLL